MYTIKHSEFPETSVLTSVYDKTCAGLDGAGLADTQAGPVGKTSVHLDRHSHHHRHNNHHRHNKCHFSSAIAITTSIVILIFARSLNDQLCENLYVLYNCLYLGLEFKSICIYAWSCICVMPILFVCVYSCVKLDDWLGGNNSPQHPGLAKGALGPTPDFLEHIFVFVLKCFSTNSFCPFLFSCPGRV